VKRALFSVLALVALVGCGPKHDLFPLELGNTWTYTVSSDLAKSVAKMKVVRNVPVGEAEGYELQSDLGIYHLAWTDGTLVAASLAGTRFYPPLPLLIGGQSTASRDWSGKVAFMGKQTSTKAQLLQEPGSVTIGAKKVDCTKVVTSMTIEGKDIVVESYFAPGIGLVEQTQRVGGLLTIGMKYQEGPSKG
jgi:hypothetical protein